MGTGCCIKIDQKNNSKCIQQQELKKDQALRDLTFYYKANKSYMNQKVKLIYKQICKTGIYDLELINLSFVSFSKSRSEHLLQILPYFENVKILKLWKSGLGSEGIKIISQELENLKFLEILSMEDNSIGPNGAMYLASAIAKMIKLRELWLHINDIGATGASSIADVLINFPDLERLGLDENSIEDKGAFKIINSIKSLKKLKLLSLGYNSITPDSALELVKTLSHMPLEKLVLSGNNISEATENSLKLLMQDTLIIV
jgi:Ran GTPase-activating protein (RanGAP) involved in mRNA processing and transport